MKFGLRQQDLAEIVTILQRFPAIDEAIIFGSRLMLFLFHAAQPPIHSLGVLYQAIPVEIPDNTSSLTINHCRLSLLVQEEIERFGHWVLAFCRLTNRARLAIQVAEVPGGGRDVALSVDSD